MSSHSTRGLTFMDELRSQIKAINRFPTDLHEPLTRVHGTRDFFDQLEPPLAQGVMVMYNYMYPMENKAEWLRNKKLLAVLQSVRKILLTRMRPLMKAYLFNPFEKAECSYDVKLALSKGGEAPSGQSMHPRVAGALALFDMIHPEEVQPARTGAISFTVALGPPPRAAHTVSPIDDFDRRRQRRLSQSASSPFTRATRSLPRDLLPNARPIQTPRRAARSPYRPPRSSRLGPLSPAFAAAHNLSSQFN